MEQPHEDPIDTDVSDDAGDRNPGKAPIDSLRAPITSRHALENRYPYMFAGKSIGIELYRGWFALLVQLCADIDAVLGEDKRGFRWVQIKEKFGTCRLYYDMNRDGDVDESMSLEPVPGAGHVRFRRKPDEASDDSPLPMAHRIRALVSRAEDATRKMCMACGGASGVRSFGGNYLNLCDRHAPDMTLTEDESQLRQTWDRVWQSTEVPLGKPPEQSGRNHPTDPTNYAGETDSANPKKDPP